MDFIVFKCLTVQVGDWGDDVAYMKFKWMVYVSVRKKSQNSWNVPKHTSVTFSSVFMWSGIHWTDEYKITISTDSEIFWSCAS